MVFGPIMGYNKIVNNKHTNMTNSKAQARPTPAQLQRMAAKAARRQAAMDRQTDDYRQDDGFQAIYGG